MFKKPSFLERLTGSVTVDDFDEDYQQEEDSEFVSGDMMADDVEGEEGEWVDDKLPETQQEGELPIDMYQTGDAVVIRALVAGVSPDDLDIAITRDMVTIKGSREEEQEAPDENYFHRELYWGSFTRTILLPEEVLIDEADAKERHGFLEIVLPKVDKDRSTQLKVKAHAK